MSTRKDADGLTDKQRRFVDEYLIDLNGTAAVIRAGYSARRASEIAYSLLQKPAVAKAIATSVEQRNKRTKIDADYVLRRLMEIDQLDVLDILNDDLSLKALSQWPRAWRLSLSALDVSEMVKAGDDPKATQGVLKKIKWPDKVKNLELLGRHVDVGAFKDRVDVTITDNRAERMARARERAASPRK